MVAPSTSLDIRVRTEQTTQGDPVKRRMSRFVAANSSFADGGVRASSMREVTTVPRLLAASDPARCRAEGCRSSYRHRHRPARTPTRREHRRPGDWRQRPRSGHEARSKGRPEGLPGHHGAQRGEVVHGTRDYPCSPRLVLTLLLTPPRGAPPCHPLSRLPHAHGATARAPLVPRLGCPTSGSPTSNTAPAHCAGASTTVPEVRSSLPQAGRGRDLQDHDAVRREVCFLRYQLALTVHDFARLLCLSSTASGRSKTARAASRRSGPRAPRGRRAAVPALAFPARPPERRGPHPRRRRSRAPQTLRPQMADGEHVRGLGSAGCVTETRVGLIDKSRRYGAACPHEETHPKHIAGADGRKRTPSIARPASSAHRSIRASSPDGRGSAGTEDPRRVSAGRGAGLRGHTVAAVCTRVPQAVVCLLTALQMHQLTTASATGLDRAR